MTRGAGNVPLSYLLTGHLPIVRPMTWDFLQAHIQRVKMLHVFMKLSEETGEPAKDDDSIAGSMEDAGHVTAVAGSAPVRKLLAFALAELNEAVDEQGNVCHRQVRVKLGDSKPHHALEAKVSSWTTRPSRMITVLEAKLADVNFLSSRYIRKGKSSKYQS